ncbi:hypothetical protein EIN_186560 [Entamoeba invadens IP1]|uniref:hypothetical protein n=1 Tax=Entamoeba invadens IP1 TaxID=370355 RepID=UPI0002C3EAC7|nr:hypothetical protein EIN_186560 [Entamoeba invadens IP1]ELP94229.1 hypothetical protein EIN_186560 [Entamoeba invadens IP1]|eukprot:XP_004261000.1 hypothetical protein EIN_186560 [Entamoeba invadens IP1]
MTELAKVVQLRNTPEMGEFMDQIVADITTPDTMSNDEFIKRLRITTEDTTQVSQVDNDYERELVFYRQALTSVVQARQIFNEMKYPYKRPADYFAEMFKDDSHMDKIRPELMKIQKKIDAVEQRKKNLIVQKEENNAKREKRKQETIRKVKAKKDERKKRFRDKAYSQMGRSDGSSKLNDHKSGKSKGVFSKRVNKGGKSSGPKGGKGKPMGGKRGGKR